MHVFKVQQEGEIIHSEGCQKLNLIWCFSCYEENSKVGDTNGKNVIKTFIRKIIFKIRHQCSGKKPNWALSCVNWVFDTNSSLKFWGQGDTQLMPNGTNGKKVIKTFIGRMILWWSWKKNWKLSLLKPILHCNWGGIEGAVPIM